MPLEGVDLHLDFLKKHLLGPGRGPLASSRSPLFNPEGCWQKPLGPGSCRALVAVQTPLGPGSCHALVAVNPLD